MGFCCCVVWPACGAPRLLLARSLFVRPVHSSGSPSALQPSRVSQRSPAQPTSGAGSCTRPLRSSQVDPVRLRMLREAYAASFGGSHGRAVAGMPAMLDPANMTMEDMEGISDPKVSRHFDGSVAQRALECWL